MSELLPKPSLTSYLEYPYISERDACISFVKSERDYYRRLAEFAVEALNTIHIEANGCGPECSKDFLRLGINSVIGICQSTLSTIKQSEQS